MASDNGPELIDSRAQAFTMSRAPRHSIHADEIYSAPIFNYARLMSWTQNVEKVVAAFHYASRRANTKMCVNAGTDWVEGDGQFGRNPENYDGSMEQVIAYCAPPPDEVLNRSRWGPDILSRMFVASSVALLLQWGTSGAAIMIVWETPTVGLGCYSGSFLLYAGASTLVWILLVISSVLTHFLASTKLGPRVRNFGMAITIVLRRSGKILSTFNAIWIVLACALQFGNFFQRCFCNSSSFGLRDHAFDIIEIHDTRAVKGVWIGGVAFASGTALLFVIFVNLFVGARTY